MRAPPGTCADALDVDAIRHAAAALIGEHDFRAFRASDCDRRTTSRIDPPLSTSIGKDQLLTFDVEATAFLKNMVRILVGTLVDVGRGRVPQDIVTRMLRERRPHHRRHHRPGPRPHPVARDLLSS